MDEVAQTRFGFGYFQTYTCNSSAVVDYETEESYFEEFMKIAAARSSKLSPGAQLSGD